LGRISKFLTAEELPEPYKIDQTLPLAVHINGDFTWETVLNAKEEKSKAEEKSKDTTGKDKKKKTDNKVPKDEALQSRWWKSKKTADQDQLPSTVEGTNITGDGNTDSTEMQEEPPFSLKGLRFEAPKGAFVAIVGRVGCGKVSEKITCA
jgi:ATP-binding cassette, subfamily C (CFTR/MRP), member 1